VGNFIVPTTLDATPTTPVQDALLIDILLLCAFGIQHSGMARPFFKQWLTKWIPAAAERSVYVLASSLGLIALMKYWSPIGGSVWNIQGPFGWVAAYALFAFGWVLVLISTFVINHFDLFGLRQAWFGFRGRPCKPVKFVTPWLYRIVRHPLYLGWLLAFWATPTMTSSHLLFAIVATTYILVAIQLEENDLAEVHPEYKEYQRSVPMLIPRFVLKSRPAYQDE